MGWVKRGNVRGPQGPQGPQATTQQVFLAAHPVGSYYESDGGAKPSDFGGTWQRIDSPGRGELWRRVS